MNQLTPELEQRIKQLLSTREGQALLQIFSSQSGDTLKQAEKAAISGNQSEAMRLISPLLNRKDVQSLLAELEQKTKNG